MKKKIEVLNDSKVVFSGYVSNIPIRESVVLSKCIELFDDDDPCIINKSYAIKTITLDIEKLIDKISNKQIEICDYYDSILNSIDIESLDECIIQKIN
ncbi:hypothetical protein [Clostridium folliculivorans]|uniref:Uncharacterized protein n=1 Tax=Clostridium folliculivorans TaxID=2886038 RepID=A0A9W5Y048_9CLOT|nr:hypothetical protein [Clostridium folliculivorans]GKU24087.1 hypothetical protein CFOLD11_09130 [Clostridium folliculivorans]GKU30193.1 hypothetical protein CFB3_23000 [Clostridium folliculivorans]